MRRRPSILALASVLLPVVTGPVLAKPISGGTVCCTSTTRRPNHVRTAAPRGRPLRARAGHHRPELPVILIDAGHGGPDSGAVGFSGTLEKTVALATAQELARQLEATHHYRVVLTRNSDVFVPLQTRLRMVGSTHAALMISIHADASTNPRVRGASIYVRSAGPDATVTQLPAHRGASPAMADALKEPPPGSELLQLALVSSLDDDILMTRSPARHAHLHVLAAACVPSVLVEMGYITNRQDEALLRKPRHRATIARAIRDAVEDYFHQQPGTPKPHT